MKYSRFSTNDFVRDEYFQRWIFGGQESVDRFWISWLNEHPEKVDEVNEAKQILERIHFEPYTLPEHDLTALWTKIHEDEQVFESRELSATHRRQWMTGIAAAITLTLVGFIYLWTNQSPWKEYRTAYGETSSITLPDGSNVVLNANSSLIIEDEWNDFAMREITIDGEAYFNVVHKRNNQPFKVHTPDGVTVEVLGTAFNVYNRMNGTKIILNSGQIRLNLPLEKSPGQIVMRPGEMVEYSQKKYLKRDVDPQLYTSWTNNRIILDRTSLAEMVQMLRDTYGLEVKADSTLLRQTVSGSMPLGDAEVLLDQMAKAFQLKVTREGNLIKVNELNK